MNAVQISCQASRIRQIELSQIGLKVNFDLPSSIRSLILNRPPPWPDLLLFLPSWDPETTRRSWTNREPLRQHPAAERSSLSPPLRTGCRLLSLRCPASHKLPRLSSLNHCRSSGSRACCPPRGSRISLSCCLRRRASLTGSRSLCSGPLKCCWRRTASSARRGSSGPPQCHLMTLSPLVFPTSPPSQSGTDLTASLWRRSHSERLY